MAQLTEVADDDWPSRVRFLGRAEDVALATTRGRISIFSNERLVSTFRVGLESFAQFDVDPRAGTLAATGQGAVELWKVPEGLLLERWELAPAEDFQAVCFSANGERLLVASDHETIRILAVEGGEVLGEFRGGGERNPALFLHPNGTVLGSVGCFQGGSLITFRHLDRGGEVLEEKVLSSSFDVICPASFSPDGKTFAFADEDLRVYEFPSLRLRYALDPRGAVLGQPREGLAVEGYWSNAVFTPDGREAACGSCRGEILFCRVDDGGVSRALAGHEAGVIAIDIDATGSRLVSCGYDRTVRLWDLAKDGGRPSSRRR